MATQNLAHEGDTALITTPAIDYTIRPCAAVALNPTTPTAIGATRPSANTTALDTLILTNNAASANTVTISSDDNTVAFTLIIPSLSTLALAFTTPLCAPTDNGWTGQCSVALSTVTVLAAWHNIPNP